MSSERTFEDLVVFGAQLANDGKGASSAILGAGVKIGTNPSDRERCDALDPHVAYEDGSRCCDLGTEDWGDNLPTESREGVNFWRLQCRP